MHNALLILEVLSRIFSYLAEGRVRYPNAIYGARLGDSQKAGRRALAVLARTCRAFSEPALDALWRRLHNLTPFLQASYDDLEEDQALPPFNEEEWNTLSRYAPRVRELTLDDEFLSVKILQSLWFRTTLLLPNLQKLRWDHWNPTYIGSLRLLLSPSLVHLDVRLEADNHTYVQGFLQCYHTLCPNLKSLRFRHLNCSLHVTTAVSRAISCSPNVETLACGFIDEAALIHIAESRRLKKITATLVALQPEVLRRLAGYGTPDHPPFENLRVLRLEVQDLSSFIPYLRAYHQPFEEVSLEVNLLPAPQVLHEFFTALSSASRQATLRRIRFRPDYKVTRRERTSSQLVDFQVLSPLMTFNLYEFDVDLYNLVSLNDDELARLVQAWPELETFYFNRRSGWENRRFTQIPTLKGLLLLPAQCPKLRALGMCVDARKIPSLTKDESLIRNMAITRLFVGNSLIQEPLGRVAQFLLDHFPSLVALSSRMTVETLDTWRMWDKVDAQIKDINGRGCSRDASDDEMHDSEME